MLGELRAFRRPRLSPEEGRAAATKALATPISERAEKSAELHLDDPETLLPFLEALRRERETSPQRVLEETSYLYKLLNSMKPRYPADRFLLDEREYFLGESAHIAGTASRLLALRDEARKWFDHAEGWFLATENAAGNLAKIRYQRLALRVEERDFEELFVLLPQLVDTFERLGMSEDALKTRFLIAAVLKETDRLDESADTLKEIVRLASEYKLDALLGQAYVVLTHIYGILGQTQLAVMKAREATPILQQVGNRIGLAKLHWGIGYLQRSNHDTGGAIDSFRSAQQEFSELGMRADVAAVQLVIADLLLDASQEKQAEWEIRQALPLIDEYKLVPEGFAAMTLLRESLRRQKIDRQALRDLHGYFEELQG